MSGAGAVSSNSLSVVGGGGGESRVLLELCQGETFVLENIHPYPLVIGLGSGQLRTGYPFCTRQTLSNLVYALLIVVCHTISERKLQLLILILPNGSVPGPSIFYVIYNDPLLTPLWRHSTKPQCRGPITWQC